MLRFIRFLSRDERGVSALEYAVLAGVIIAAVLGISSSFGTGLSGLFTGLITKAGG